MEVKRFLLEVAEPQFKKVSEMRIVTKTCLCLLKTRTSHCHGLTYYPLPPFSSLSTARESTLAGSRQGVQEPRVRKVIATRQTPPKYSPFSLTRLSSHISKRCIVLIITIAPTGFKNSTNNCLLLYHYFIFSIVRFYRSYVHKEESLACSMLFCVCLCKMLDYAIGLYGI